ncbi:hypothetical protein COE20_13720 [Bacillus cereus]|nr:hypothetical protein CON05_04945 [Bacillus cereus]PFE49737.1 hypothetical protein CN317_05105 [Bacillus cereus]PFN12173.1 hypothetical protein COJ72_27940 [Bacillus cereus]PFS57490.1 hypothetical protein COK41_23890 [Bacillus cereus]PFS73486.1 hypothetical protein COK56_26795 [Bacillus cereus]
MSHEIEKSINSNQIFMSKFLILYDLLGVLEPVIKEKMRVGVLAQTIFHNKRKRAHIKACSLIRKIDLYERRDYIQYPYVCFFEM